MKKIYKINEIFESIQGEGGNAGKLSIFIRFAGCNMSCDFCDTNFDSYTEMTIDEIYDEVLKYNSRTIVFTGGEPMLQLDAELCQIFQKNYYYIQIETNGSIKINFDVDKITVSPKDPNKWNQKTGNDLKFLVNHKDIDLLDQIYDDCIFDNYYVQPIDGFDYQANVDKCIELIKQHPDWKLSLQIHKILKIK